MWGPAWLRVDRLFGEWGIPKDSPAGREVFRQRMERQRLEGRKDEFLLLARGWYLGDEQFRRELLEAVHTLPGPSHFGEEVQEAGEERALIDPVLVAGPVRFSAAQASAALSTGCVLTQTAPSPRNAAVKSFYALGV